MNILLVYANTYRMLAPPPVGLSLMVGPLRRAGHRVRLVDLMKEADPDLALRRALEAERPDLVGLSLRNLDTQDMQHPRDFVPDYARWVALANEHAPTIIGGSAVMAAPEALLERTGATYGMVGQGTRAFPALLTELAAGRTGDFTAPGVLWRQGGRVSANPGEHDGYAGDGSIDWDVIDHRRYRASYNNCCVITKTGCPHRCIFCDASVSYGPSFVPRAPEAVVEDLRRDATRRGFHRLDYFLIDALLNEPLDWAKQLMEAIIRFEHRIIFMAVIEPTPSFDRELAVLMRRAGCGMVTALVGSWDDDVLARARRPFTAADAHRAFGLLESAGVPYMVYYMLGGPGETRETVGAIFEHDRRRKPLINYASYGIRILPHAGIHDIALAEGVIAPDDDLLTPRFYLSEALRGQEAWLDGQLKRLNRPRLAALPQMASYTARSMAVRFQR